MKFAIRTDEKLAANMKKATKLWYKPMHPAENKQSLLLP